MLAPQTVERFPLAPPRMPSCCPHCGSDVTRRLHRPLWMRLIFRAKRCYECMRCGATYLTPRSKPH